MKKKVITIILMALLTLSGCSDSNLVNPDVVFKSPNNKIIDLEIIDNNFYSYILVDKNTRVLYYWNVSGASGITPIYNADGTLKLYEE